MSQITSLAQAVRALDHDSAGYMRALQSATRDVRMAQQLCASAPTGRSAAGSLSAALSGIERCMSSLGAFSQGARNFADQLASGSGGGGGAGGGSGAGVAMAGAHGALVSTTGTTTTTTRVDPLTGNTMAWTTNSSGQCTEFKAHIENQSAEGRTAAESRATAQVGRSTRAERNDANRFGADDGGHIGSANLLGSNGKINLFAQNANFNRGAYKKFENEVTRLVNSGKPVDMRVNLKYPHGSSRPSSLRVSYRGSGMPKTKNFFNEKHGKALK